MPDFVVDSQDAGIRLDAFLVERLACSRARARAMLEAGLVVVGDHSAGGRDKGRRLEAGTRVHLDADPSVLDALRPAPEAPLTVLAEGDGWIVVDKPAGVPVHPLRADETATLLQRVAARVPGIEGVGEGGLRSGVVHRLDVDTSGCQAFATQDDAFGPLRAAFREHTVDKVYRALVVGAAPEHGDTALDLFLARHRPARVRAVAAGEGPSEARTCATRWRCLEVFDANDGPVSLIEARPHSGFLHQIRVTMAFHGHPLLGDAVYGTGARAARHLLHASALRWGEIDVTSPDAEDFAAVLRSLRG